MKLYRKLIEKTLREGVTPFSGDRSNSYWRKQILKEDDWFPVDRGIANSTSQTFAYGDPGSGIEVTLSGLGGVEAHPSTVTIDGETYDSPTYSQLAMQGYAKPLGFGVERRTDFQDVNPYLDASQQFAQAVGADYMMNARVQTIEEDLKKIAARFDSSLIENIDENIKLAIEAIKNGQQPPLVSPPDPPYTGMSYEQMVDEQNKISDKYNDLIYPLNKELDKYAGQLAPAGLVAKINALVEEQNKKQNEVYEKYSKYNEEYGNLLAKRADEWGKFVNAIESYRKGFSFNPPSQEVAQVAFAPITTKDEININLLRTLPAMLNKALPGTGFFGDLSIKYMKGDTSPVTKSPGKIFDLGVMNVIRNSLKSGDKVGSVTDTPYNRMSEIEKQGALPVRLALGQFGYNVTANGIEINDKFDFEHNKNVGELERYIPGAGELAGYVVDTGLRRAVQKGYKPINAAGGPISPGGEDYQSPKGYNIPIRYTIPWSQVPADLQNKLDPYQRIVPINKKKTQNESTTWNRIQKYR